jgi:hypothetical protein
MPTDYTSAEERRDPAAYEEKPASYGEIDWHRACKEDLPPRIHHILAYDGIRTAEAWVNADGNFMRVNARWEWVYGSRVLLWAHMPKPKIEGGRP